MTDARSAVGASVPLWVGAVGHRLLRPGDEPALRMAVGKVLDEISARWGRELEPRLLSSLAEGADRLIAEEALARGWQVVAPLPLPIELYEKDFSAEGSQESFRSFLQQSAMYFDVGLEPGATLDDVSRPGPARDRQYARAGEYIADACQILIALWDGEYSGRVGGTSEVVGLLVRGPVQSAKALDVLDAPAPKLVYHVWTPSRDHPDPTDKRFSHRVLVPGGDSNREHVVRVFEQVLQRLIEFHRDAAEIFASSPGSIEESIADVIPRSEAAGLPKSVEETLRWYGVADALAIRCQRAIRPALPVLLVLAFAALAGFELHTHWPSHPPRHPIEALVVFLALFLLALLVFFYFHHRGLERRYLDYRALAEGLRVQIFWRLSGIPDSVSLHYLRRHRGELSWIPAAIAGMSVGTALPNPKHWGDEWPLGRRRRLTRDHWLDAQLRFFINKSKAVQSAFRYWRRFAFMLFAAAILFALALMLLPIGIAGEWEEFVRKVAFIAIPLLLAASAAGRYFMDRRAYEAEARRYGMMHVLFARGLGAVGDDRESLESHETGEIFRELGRESLAENGDWLLIHRDRPLEIPTLG